MGRRKFPIELDAQTIATLDKIAADRHRSRTNLIEVIVVDWLNAPRPEKK